MPRLDPPFDQACSVGFGARVQGRVAHVVLALVLRDRGWRVTFLGADTPIETIADTTRRVAPEVIVLAMLKAPEVELRDMRELTRGTRVLISGRGANSALARKLAVEHFAGGPIEAAAYLADAQTSRGAKKLRRGRVAVRPRSWSLV